MTKLNLNEACLLEASGELGPKASEQLHAYIERHASARRELENAKTQLAMLQTIPVPELSAADRTRIASTIKQAVHKKLAKIEREEKAQQRWKLIYRAMTAVS